jgi:hypothetical protein
MELIVALLIAGGVAAAGVAALKRRRSEREQNQAARLQVEVASEPRGLEALRPEDVLLHDRLELLVCGVASLAEATASHWQECRAADGRAVRWLVLRPEDPEHLLIGEAIEGGLGLDDAVEPSEQLEHEQAIFRLERCGQASATFVGDLDGALAAGELRYWDYARPGAERLWLRRGEAGTRCFRGRRVGRHLVTFLPGS